MSKKDKIKTIEVDDVNLVPELLDGNHRVIPIVTGGDEPVEEVEVPEIIPILTLRSSVLFPGAITPITVGRDKSINLVRAVNAEGGILGAVLQRESDVEDPAPDDMYKVGTAARIIKILEMPNGNLTVILNGLEKIEITEYITTEPYFKARVTALRDSTPDVKSIEFEALVDSIRDVALNIINVSPSMPKEAAFAIKNIDSKRGIINFICSNMELTDEDRQSLLEAPGLLARARKLLEILIREQQLAELKNQIQERVKQEIDKQQRDYYLQQQMRTIQVRPFPSVRSHVRRQGWLHAPRLPLRADIDRERKQRPLYPTQTAPWTKHSTSAAVAAQMARISSSVRLRSRITRANPASPKNRAPSGVRFETCVEACSSTGRSIRRRAMSCTISASTPASIRLRACRSAASSSSSHTSVLSVAWTRTPKRWAYSTTRAISSAEFPAACRAPNRAPPI